MIEHNGSAKSPGKTAARNMVKLAHDVLTLAELQVRLLKIELRDGLRGLIAPIVLLIAATCLALGSVPVLLLSVAYGLVELFGLSQALSLLVAFTLGLAVAGLIGVSGWYKLRQTRRLLQRSHEELTRNINWIKHVLKQETARTSTVSDPRRMNDV